MDWREKYLESLALAKGRRGLALPSDVSWVLFERGGEGIEFCLVDCFGFGGTVPVYGFLEEDRFWDEVAGRSLLRVSSEFLDRKDVNLWALFYPARAPRCLALVEVLEADEDVGLFLWAALMRYLALASSPVAAVSRTEDCPGWVLNGVAEMERLGSPMLVVSEPGSGQDEMVDAFVANQFAGSEALFSPGNLSEAVQMREIFGGSAGKRLGGVGAGVPIIRREESVVVIREAGHLAPAVQLKFLSLFAGGGSEGKFWIFETSRDLLEMVGAGLFEKGLYNILKKNEVVLVPLRFQGSELSVEIRRLLESFRVKYRRDISISDDAVSALLEYDWPGNWRELCEVLESAFQVCSGGVVKPEDLRLGNALQSAGEDDLNLRKRLAVLEKELLLQAYSMHGGNQVHMAKALGISRGSLQYKFEKYGLGKTGD